MGNGRGTYQKEKAVRCQITGTWHTGAQQVDTGQTVGKVKTEQP